MTDDFDFGGECGVAFFYVLSGFVASWSQGPKVEAGTFSTRRFVWHQLRKFYVIHLLAMAFMIWRQMQAGIDVHWYQVAAQTLLLQSWIPSRTFIFFGNGVSWFLCDIVFCYLMFRTVYKWMQRRKDGELLLCLVGFVAIYLPLAAHVPGPIVNEFLYAPPLLRLFDFALGMMLCRFIKSPKTAELRESISQLTVRQATIRELIIVGILISSYYVYEALPHWISCCAMFWPIMPVVVGYFAMADKCGGLITRALHHPWLLTLGKWSLYIFLLHLPVLHIIYTIIRLLG